MKEERQAHAKASQQQLDKHEVEVQDGQQGTAGASPSASMTQLEDQVQVQVHSLTFPLHLAFYVSPSSACLDPGRPGVQLCDGLQTLISNFQLPFTDCLWAWFFLAAPWCWLAQIHMCGGLAGC